jgi:hypothetical protein
MENSMNAMERIIYYTDTIPHERADLVAETQPPADWPQTGG